MYIIEIKQLLDKSLRFFILKCIGCGGGWIVFFLLQLSLSVYGFFIFSNKQIFGGCWKNIKYIYK